MNYVVTKAFKTATRKFAVGDKITFLDIDPLYALSLADLVSRDFIKQAAAEAPTIAEYLADAPVAAAPRVFAGDKPITP